MRKTFITAVLAVMLPTCLCAQLPKDRTEVENAIVNIAAAVEEQEFETSLEALDVLYQLDSTYDAVLYYKGLCEMELGRYDEAERHLARAVVADTLNTYYMDALADLFGRTRQTAKEMAVYRMLVRRHPGKYSNPYVLTLLGDGELSFRRDSLALDYYEQALMVDGSYAPALLGKAEVCRMTGRYPAFFTTVTKICADPELVASAKVRYLTNVIERVDATIYRYWHTQLDTLVGTCASTHPEDSCVLKFAGRWFYGTMQKDRGKAYFDECVRLYPKDVDIRFIHLSVLLDMEDYNAALKECDEVLRYARDDSDRTSAYSIKGECYHKMAKIGKMYRMYDKVLKIDPDDKVVLNNYAWFMALEGRNLKKALKMSARTIELEPDNPTFLDTYARILYLMKRPAEAKPVQKKALVYGGMDDANLLRHYADILEALGEDDIAQYYRRMANNNDK